MAANNPTDLEEKLLSVVESSVIALLASSRNRTERELLTDLYSALPEDMRGENLLRKMDSMSLFLYDWERADVADTLTELERFLP